MLETYLSRQLIALVLTTNLTTRQPREKDKLILVNKTRRTQRSRFTCRNYLHEFACDCAQLKAFPHHCPLPSARQHPSYGDCLEVKRDVLSGMLSLYTTTTTLITAVILSVGGQGLFYDETLLVIDIFSKMWTVADLIDCW